MTLRFPSGMRDAITQRIAHETADSRARNLDPNRNDAIRLRQRLLDVISAVGEGP
jgi:hypothetical protein